MNNPLIMPADEAVRRVRHSHEIDAVRTPWPFVPDAYHVGELCLFEEGTHVYLDRCVGHDPERRSFYFRTLAEF
jgi:hypothetical protein